MLSRENRVFLTSWTLLAAFVLTSVLAETTHGAVGWFVAIAGFGFLGPQLYLARADESVPARSRLRIGVLLTLWVAFLGFSHVATSEQLVIWLLCGILFTALLGYEFVGGYRTAIGS